MYLTSHAKKRLRQRGMRESDVSLIYRYGTQLGDGILLTRRDIQAATTELRKTITQLEHLKGRVVIVQTDAGITVYKASLKTQRKMLREAH